MRVYPFSRSTWVTLLNKNKYQSFFIIIKRFLIIFSDNLSDGDSAEHICMRACFHAINMSPENYAYACQPPRQ